MSEAYKILWVDDEESLRDIMCEILHDEGYFCQMAENGLEATQMLETEKFDLVISDFNMPHMDGVGLLFWLRQHEFHLPVIFVSGNTELLPLEKLVLNDCCTAVLNKPFSIEQLLEAIEKAKKRNHDYECLGRELPLDKGDYRHSFPGQHFLSDNP